VEEPEAEQNVEVHQEGEPNDRRVDIDGDSGEAPPEGDRIEAIYPPATNRDLGDKGGEVVEDIIQDEEEGNRKPDPEKTIPYKGRPSGWTIRILNHPKRELGQWEEELFVFDPLLAEDNNDAETDRDDDGKERKPPEEREDPDPPRDLRTSGDAVEEIGVPYSGARPPIRR
jgi:hypothetical protein